MTEPQTKTVQTEYGEATIETYDCDSCGNTVAYEETVEFTIGDREGRACSHCDDNGPISFPQKVVKQVWDVEEPWGEGFWISFFLPYLPTIAFILNDYTNETKHYYAAGFMRATFVWFLWAVISGVVWWLL